MIRNAGCTVRQLLMLFRAWILSRIMYCSTLFSSITQAELKLINRVFCTAKRWNLISDEMLAEEVLKTRGKEIFKQICSNRHHPLHHLLPPKREKSTRRKTANSYNSPYEIPHIRTVAYRKSFFIDSLFLQ